MRFTSLCMKDFRATRDLEIGFEPDVTVIVGRNGAGKTSILDVLCLMMQFLHARLDEPWRDFLTVEKSDLDIRIDADKFVLGLEFSIEDPSLDSVDRDILEAIGCRDQHRVDFRFCGMPERNLSVGILRPHFIYFRQERGFESENILWAMKQATEVLNPESIQNQSLEKDMQAIKGLEAWWDRRDAQEARKVRDEDQDYRDPQLEVIRNLVARIDGFSGIVFHSTASPPGLQLVKSDSTPVNVRSLSSGERSFIVLLADLARRLQVLEPGKKLENIAAIVLIDEIELNLHPAWQSKIVPILSEAFSACQFIVTTHSPQVLSGVGSRQVRIVEVDATGGSSKVTTPLSTHGRTSNYLLEGVLGASERFPPVDALIGEFNAAIDRGDADAAAAGLAELEEEIGDDAATLLVLRKRLKKLRGAE